MKRMIAILLAVLTMTVVLAACSNDGVSGNGNVSTTPNGTVNGSNGSVTDNYGTGANGNGNSNGDNNGVNGNNGTATTPNGNTNNGTLPNGEYDRDHDGIVDDFENGVENAIDGTRDAIDEAVTGRSARTGTGMIGGR